MISLLTCFLGNNAKQVVPRRSEGAGHSSPLATHAVPSPGITVRGWGWGVGGGGVQLQDVCLATPKNMNEGGSGKLTNA